MPAQSDIFAALAREKALGASEVARGLGISRQHAHRLLRGERDAGARTPELERLLALGADEDEGPFYALAHLQPEGGVELLTAGGTQPLFERRETAERAAAAVAGADVAIVPVWRGYAWRHLARAYAVWGTVPEPRNVFVADGDPNLPLDAVLAEVAAGIGVTLELVRRAGEVAPAEAPLH
jgi:hypothetical protein